jgi:hypothetical protein
MAAGGRRGMTRQGCIVAFVLALALASGAAPRRSANPRAGDIPLSHARADGAIE